MQVSALLLAMVLVMTPAVSLAQTASPSNQGKVREKSAKVAARLEEAKLLACQKKEANITKRSASLVKTSENMQQKFDSITEKVKAYYTAKAVPAGRVVNNYDALIAEIENKKTAIKTAVEKAQTDAAAFRCDGDDPKGQLTLYRTDMQAVKKALHEYRVAIKNLIVAIRSAHGKAQSSTKPNNSPSPTPAASATPEVQ